MKDFIRKIIIFLVVLLPLYAFAQDLEHIRISLIAGDVQIYTSDTGEWVAASINMPLKEDDRLWIPKGGRTELHFKGGTYIRLDSNTSFSILSLEDRSAQFYIDRGHAYLNNRRGGIENIQIDTPLSSVNSYDNSILMVDVSENGSTEVSVLKGYAHAENRSGKTRVSAGKSLYITEDLHADLSPIGPSDEWERWNRQRDKKLYDAGESLRYLPDELKEYSSDFEHNGRWVYTGDYGYIWVPSIVVSVGWSPYRIGRWVWISGNYVWVSYESWGWVPYHYGRWSFIAGIGWGWVPPTHGAVFWGPGFVAWVHTPAYIAWVPLAPEDVYYARGYYGPGSVNIVNINIQQTVIKEFRNVNVKNAVTIVHRDTFIKGKRVDIKIKENPFFKEKVNIGPPDIKPGRETAIPAIKRIPESKMPPEKVRVIKTEEIRRERKLSKNAESSVFRPDTKSERMPVKEMKEPSKMVTREKQKKMIDAEKRTSKSEIPKSKGQRKFGTPVTPEESPKLKPESVPKPEEPVIKIPKTDQTDKGNEKRIEKWDNVPQKHRPIKKNDE